MKTTIRRLILAGLASLTLFQATQAASLQGGDRGAVPARTMQQTMDISGNVTDASGQPLVGIGVIVVGTTIGTFTDADGAFLLRVPTTGTLQFSSIGFLTYEVPISVGRTVYDAILHEDSEMLDATIVVGYGIQKKSDVTGSVAEINTEQMMKRTPLTIAQGLQGAAAGVIVTQASGDPTGGASIRIRGVATMNGNTDPLWVVDGVQHGNASNLDWLDPNDVEDIEILKDASATAIYGSRGANGVILVTTKKGEAGRLRVDFRSDFGISTYARRLDVASLDEWLVAYRQAIANDGKVAYEAYNGNYDGQLDEIDWQDVMTRNAFRQNYHLTISGGSDALVANASIGWLDNDGIITNSWRKRLTMRLGVTANIKKAITLGFTSNFETNKGKGGGNMTSYARLIPTMDYVQDGQVVHVPVVYEDGTFGHYEFNKTTINVGAGKYSTNPYADQHIRKYKDDWDNDNGSIRNNAFIDVKLLPGLTFHSDLSMYFGASNSWYYNGEYINNEYTWEGLNGEDQLDEFGTYGWASTSWAAENYLTFDRTFGAHHLTLMAGHSASKTHGSWNSSSTKDLSFSFLRGFFSNNPTDYDEGDGAPYDSERFLSYFARLNYGLRDRYLLTATIRRDGSSKFGADRRWGTFPSASVAWRASQEPFIKDLGLFSNLKLRAGWGQTGNANVDPTDALMQLSASGVSFDFFDALGDYVRYQGLAKTKETDTGLQWETSQQTNIGVDMGFMKGSLNVTLDWYDRRTKDLILYKAIRPSAGYDGITTNFGEIRNHGIEFSVNFNRQFSEDWFFSATLTGSHDVNKAIDVGTGATTSGPEGAGWDNKQVCFNGLPLGTYQGYVVDHIIKEQAEIDELNAKAVALYGAGSYYDVQATGPGDFLFKDLNGDGHITTDDKTYLGDGFPDLTWGLNLSATWKRLDFSVYLYGLIGQELLSWSKYHLITVRNESEGYYNLLRDYARNSWTESNPDAKYPKLSRDDMASNYRVSDFYVEDADYLKVSNVQVGYSLNVGRMRKYISAARVYGSVQNLATFSPYNKFGDPEVSGDVQTMGFDEGRYPFPRTFTFGVQVSF